MCIRDSLRITLTSPNGTVYTLTQNNGGAGANYDNTCFSMSATTPITSGFPPFSGSFLPQGAGGFSNYNGEDPNGDWILTIYDDATGDAGTLNNFALSFTNIGYNIIQVAGLPSGSNFPVGVTTNTFLVTDANGNTTQQSFTVTVTDNEVPSITTCPADDTFNTDQAACFAVLSLPTLPSATDNLSLIHI